MHIDDIILVGEEACHRLFVEHFSKKLKLKADGPYGVEKPGTVFYLKRRITFDEEGLEIAANKKYAPKLSGLLGVQERRERGVPSNATLDVYDAETTPEEEFLCAKEAQMFRSALGILIYLSQERLDIQHVTRILSSYMSRPTKTALSAIKKVACYLQGTSDMVLRYEQTDEFTTVFSRWKHLDVGVKASHKPHVLELFSDSNWATSKSSRKSTSSGLIFHNGHCIHSHSRGQMSIALSSMEAEVLAATGLLAEGIMLKQSLQFLLGCRQDLSDESKVEVKLYLDSTSAQALFQRIGPGRAKHLCTRILWGQEAMRRGWYKIGRIATKDNPADLNTKSLSRERREYLSKLIGLWSSSFKEEVMPKVQRIIQVLLTAGLLKGCNSDEASEMTCGGMRQAVVHNAWSLHILCWAVFILMSVIAILVFNMQRMRTQLARYRCVWRGLKKELELRRSENPFLMAEGEGEESAHSDNDDDDYDNYGDDEGDGHGGYNSHHGHDETSENGYIEGESHLRLLHPSGGGSGNGDVAGGPNPHYEDVPLTEDAEETPMKRRKCVHEGVHTMENPDENEEEENDDQQRQQPSSSSRGIDAETAQQTVSDFVAEELMQFLSPQDDDEPKEIDGEEWFVYGSMRTMAVWGLEGVPIFPEDLQKMRTKLVNEGHGPEVSLTLACRSLNEYIRELEMTRDVAWRNEIRSGRNTLRFLQHLLGMMHQNKPKAFHAAVITFNKWIESGSSLSFFSDNETTSGSECEVDDEGAEATNNNRPNETDEAGVDGPLEESEDPSGWIAHHYGEDEEDVMLEEDDEGFDG